MPRAHFQAQKAQIYPESALALLQYLAAQGAASPQDEIVKEHLAVSNKDNGTNFHRKKEIEDDSLVLKIIKKSAKVNACRLDFEFEDDKCKLAFTAQCAPAAALHRIAHEDQKSATI
ncbi:MAG: hypothetical protein EZS28_046195 [Streblomastix strix]|uniref:Uncharacterized protein n=1 Tax=Streblomastix strix TaxID=222440 RepID=A0A5J4TJ37_9EUKA|nr:MAG: hypothetical protein EZS28_046195 [Streblomastix strix]